MYIKTNKKEFNGLIDHLANLGHDGFDAILATMHKTAEDGLEIMQNNASMRTQERTGQLLDSFTLGNEYCVYDVGENDIVFGSSLYYVQMVDAGHAIVPPGYRRDYRRQKRRKKENQRYDYYEGAKFFDPSFEQVSDLFIKRAAKDLNLMVVDSSFAKRKKKRKRKKGSV